MSANISCSTVSSRKQQIGLKLQEKQFGVLDNKSLIRRFVVLYR